MADWASLPNELLHLISSRLDSPLYLLRFRSVCSSWRSSSLSPFNTSISHININTNTNTTFSLSNRTLFLITPPNSNNNSNKPWLIKLALNPRAGTARLLHPLSRSPIKRPRFALDLLRLPALDLGREFLLTDTCPSYIYMEKVVLASLQKDRFALLTIHISGKLALFRSGDSAWTIIPDMPTPYDDVCVFRGGLYAADNTGRTVTVGFDAGLGLAAEPVFGGDKKFLVECEGALLLVDKYLSSDHFCTPGLFFEDFDEDDVCEIGWERTVRFNVYKLDEEGKRWVEFNNLGDRVLFLGDDCAFSASAEDLGVSRGNCVVFRDDGLGVDRVVNGMGIFSLEDERISQLEDFPGFNELFWPPPRWVRLRLRLGLH